MNARLDEVQPDDVLIVLGVLAAALFHLGHRLWRRGDDALVEF